jgi:tetratricopeptide (TPR) repeat protein
MIENCRGTVKGAARAGRIEKRSMAISRVERLFEEALECLRKERYNRAYDLFTEAMELDPQMPEIHYNRGIAAAGLFRWPEACEAFRLAVRLQPHPDYWLRLGLAHLHLRRWDDARHDFQAALALDRGSEQARLYFDALESFLLRPDRAADAVPPICAGWFDPRLQAFAGVDPEIVPKARRRELRDFIRDVFEKEGHGCDHTHAVTEEWALRHDLDARGVCRFLYGRGLRCDCEVLHEPETPRPGRFGV